MALNQESRVYFWEFEGKVKTLLNSLFPLKSFKIALILNIKLFLKSIIWLFLLCYKSINQPFVACKTNFIHGILWNLFCIPSYMILVLWNIMKVMVLRTSKVETWFHITLYKMYCFWTIAPPNSLFLLLVNVPKMSKDIKNKNKANIWKHIKIGTFCRSQHKSFLAKKNCLVFETHLTLDSCLVIKQTGIPENASHNIECV